MIKHCGNCLHKDLSTAKEPCITCICDREMKGREPEEGKKDEGY